MGTHYVVFHDGLIKGIYEQCSHALAKAYEEYENDNAYTSIVKFYNGTERVTVYEQNEDGTKVTHFEHIEV